MKGRQFDHKMLQHDFGSARHDAMSELKAAVSSGQTIVEKSTIGKKRAEQAAMLLQGANLNGPSYRFGWHEEAAAVTGVNDYLSRRVVVTVRPR